jgi:hypothetical protein
MDRPMESEKMPGWGPASRQTRRQFLGSAAGAVIVAGTVGYSSPVQAAGDTLGILWCMPSAPGHLYTQLDTSLANAGLATVTRRHEYASWGSTGASDRLEAAKRLAGLSGTDGAVKVIVTMDSLSTEAACQVTRTMTPPLPVVAAMCGDTSQLAQNMTGLTNHSQMNALRRLRKLVELIATKGGPPSASVAVLMNPESESANCQWTELGKRPSWISLTQVTATDPDSVPSALSPLGLGIQGLLVLTDPVTAHARDKITEFANSRGIPTMHGVKDTVIPPPTSGRGLMSYGVDRDYLASMVGFYVARVLALPESARSDLRGITPGFGDNEFFVNRSTRFAQGWPIIPPAWYLLSGDDVPPHEV